MHPARGELGVHGQVAVVGSLATGSSGWLARLAVGLAGTWDCPVHGWRISLLTSTPTPTQTPNSYSGQGQIRTARSKASKRHCQVSFLQMGSVHFAFDPKSGGMHGCIEQKMQLLLKSTIIERIWQCGRRGLWLTWRLRAKNLSFEKHPSIDLVRILVSLCAQNGTPKTPVSSASLGLLGHGAAPTSIYSGRSWSVSTLWQTKNNSGGYRVILVNINEDILSLNLVRNIVRLSRTNGPWQRSTKDDEKAKKKVKINSPTPGGR